MSDPATDKFTAIQLGWIGILAQPEIKDVFEELAKPANASMRAGADLAPLMVEKGVKLGKNAKASLVPPDVDQPVGARICLSWSSTPASGAEFHCITVRSPFQNPFSTD